MFKAASDANPPDETRNQISRSNSLDSRLSAPLSSSQLAESALSNLRKSLATQRSNSLSQPPKPTGTVENRIKSRLEERLRAATTNALSGHTRGSSSGPTSATTTRPPSPHAIPLPNSPVSSPKLEPVDTLPAPAVKVTTPQESDLPHPIDNEAVSEPTDGNPEVDLPPAALGEVETEVAQEELSAISPPPTSPPVDELHERLKQLEQRFSDVSASFKKLQAEKAAADLVLQEFSSVQDVHNTSALREYLQGISQKTEAIEDEIKRLLEKTEGQETRLAELSNTKQESTQHDQIEKLKAQLIEAEALIAAGQAVDAQAEEQAASRKVEMDVLRKDLEKAQSLAKEEEEKRVKAISLLKTVRQKLVKAEKDRDDVLKELAQSKDKDRTEKEKENAERTKLRNEVEAANRARDKAISDSRAQFEKDIANVKDRYEKEMAMIKGQSDLELATVKSASEHEIAMKASHISTLEQSLNGVTRDKNAFFDSLQLRQAELESAQSHLESLQSQNTELQYQLRELDDRCALLKEDLAEAQRERDAHLHEPGPSPDEVARLLSANEAKYEAKLSALKRNLDQLEKERNNNESEWSNKLREKTTEVEELKIAIGSTAGVHERHEAVVAELKAEIAKLEGERRTLQEHMFDLQKSSLEIANTEKTWKVREAELNKKLEALEQQLEESKQQDVKTRLANKTLREELRKVQSSAALLERQRNPGVGYWGSPRVDHYPAETPPYPAPSNSSSRTGSPAVPSTTPSPDDEVNLEYIRNVILQFLEHKEMRPNLVKVLSTILRFTPQETRRLVAKV